MQVVKLKSMAVPDLRRLLLKELPLRKKRLMRKLARFWQICALFFISLTLSASEPETSALWGVKGEAWSPDTSRLKNFSNVGYMKGTVPIPNWPVGVKVTDFGATPDDLTDDSKAFMDAIAACPKNSAVFVPKGRYIIEQRITPNRDYFVLRGEDMYKTVLYMPKYMNEIEIQKVGYTKGGRHNGAPKGFWRVTEGTHRSIENLSFEFREQRKMGHWEFKGADSIVYEGKVQDCWIRNIYMNNYDHGLHIGGQYITAMNIIFDGGIRRPQAEGLGVAHIAIRGSGARFCLFHNMEVKHKVRHGFDLGGMSDNVFSQIRGPLVTFDHHSMGAKRNLYTDINIGDCQTIGKNSSVADTHWNFYGDGPMNPKTVMNEKDYPDGHIYVGFNAGLDNMTDNRPEVWYEEIDNKKIHPKNLYLAQLEYFKKPLPDDKVPKPPAPVYGDVVRLSACEQSYTHPKHRDKPLGRGAFFGGNPGFIKFDLSPVKLKSIYKVRLRLTTKKVSKPKTEIKLYKLDDDSWSEKALTLKNRPKEGALIHTELIEEKSASQVFEIDVTSYVKDEWKKDKVVSFVAFAGGSTIYGSDAGMPPELVIEQVESPVPGPPAAPKGMTSDSLVGNVRLNWNESPEADVVAYNVYRSKEPGEFKDYGLPIARNLIRSEHIDNDSSGNWNIGRMDPGIIFYYRVTAVDSHGYESEPCKEFPGVALPHPDDKNKPAAFRKKVSLAPATAGVAYKGTIASTATDPESDPLHFYKASGPEWLKISHDGTVSGTPGPNDVGNYTLKLQVYSYGGPDETMTDIVVKSQTKIPAE